MKRREKLLITGANGLAGTAVVKRMFVEGFDNLVALKRSDCDLRDTAATVATICADQPDYIFHAAATVYGLGGSMSRQGKSIFDNTLINMNVIHAAMQAKVKKIVVMGSNCAYPWPTRQPFVEDNIYVGKPDVGEFGYGHAKRHMLATLEAYQMSYGLDYTYLVSGNLYGPHDKFDAATGHVLPSLVKKFWDAKQSGSNVTIWGSGAAMRDFLYSEDLARIVQIALGDSMKGTINIGSGQSSTIREAVEHLSSISGVDMDRIRWNLDMPEGRLDTRSDLSRLMKLGFTPQYSLRQGLEATWQWFDDRQIQSP